MNTLPTQSAVPRKWYEIWREVWSHPGEAVFQSLLTEPDHSSTRAFIWIAVTSFIVALFTSYSSAQSFRNLQPSSGSIFIYMVCLVIFTPVLAVIGMVIAAGIYHGIARLFGGNGMWSNLVFCLSAVSAPSSIIAGIIELLDYLFSSMGALPLVVIMSLLSFAVAIYALILYVYALKTVENIGTGQAVLTVLIPVIIVVILAICVVLAIIPTIAIRG